MVFMNIHGLTKAEGVSFEQIVDTLSQNEIPFRVISDPRQYGGYLRTARLVLNIDSLDDMESFLGGAKNITEAKAYYAYYEINNDKFDFTILNGALRFSKGRIVERTIVQLVSYDL